MAILFVSCLASMVMYFLLCNMGVPAAPPPLRDFALLACLICSLEECFIRDAVKGLVPRTRVGVPVASVTGRATVLPRGVTGT